MLIAEELVLLALRPDGRLARGVSTQADVAVGVTGALLAELAIDGHLDLTDGRIRLTGTRPAPGLLAQALDNTAPHAGKKLSSRLGAIKHAGWSEVLDQMIASGIVGRSSTPLRPTRHPVTDQIAHARLLAELRSAAVGTSELDARTATLLALAGPCQLLEVVAPHRSDRRAARRRIDGAAELVPAAAAVRSAIDAVHAATVATIAASSAGVGSV